jgi:hypothetical protein
MYGAVGGGGREIEKRHMRPEGRRKKKRSRQEGRKRRRKGKG